MEDEVKIDSTRRYFKLKPEAVKLFDEYEASWKEAVKTKIEAAVEILEALGMEKEEVMLGLFSSSGDVAFPEQVHEALPHIFTKPSPAGYVRLKQNRKDGKALQARLDAYKVPRVSSYFPTLMLGYGWLEPGCWVKPSFGRYGNHIVLSNIPKDSERLSCGWEPDFDLLEEMTLTEWAALVEAVESAGVKG